MKPMKLKIPNILTIGRIIIVPIFILSFYLPGALGDWMPFFIFVLASFSDFLDGLLARLYKEESKLGELLDPIADKIIVASALVLLVMDQIIVNYEVVAAIIILIREILISGLREFLAKVQVTMPVTSLAKFKTFIQMFAIAILLTGESGNNLVNFENYSAHSIGIVLFITSKISAAATIILSAMGSSNSPNFDSSLYNLANKPSKKSVKLANINIKKGIKSPNKPGR